MTIMLTEAVEMWLDQLIAERKSDRTVLTYRTAMNHLLAWQEESDRPPDQTPTGDLTTRDVLDFVRWLADKDLNRGSLRVYLAGVSMFYTWLVSEELVTFNVADWTKLQMQLAHWRKGLNVNALPRLPAEPDAQAVLDAARHPAYRLATTEKQRTRLDLIELRNRAIVETLRCTGARVHEVCKLTRGDLDGEHRRAKVRGKGNRERLLRFDGPGWRALQAYLEARDKLGLPGNGQQPLFIRHDKAATGKALPLSTNAVRSVLTRLCKEAGLEDNLTPHQFRHRFGTLMLEQTGDVTLVQKLLGHESVATTQIYAHVSDKRLDEAYDNAEL